MSKSEIIDIGVVVERRKLDNPWQEWSWRPVAVIPGAGPVSRWKELHSGKDWTQFHAATLPVELHHKETEGYIVNLGNQIPAVYVVLRDAEDEDAEYPVEAHLVTLSPYEAQDYLDSGEETVEALPMPESIEGWIREFVGRNHVEEPFIKRKRDRLKIEDHKFGKEPIFSESGRVVGRGTGDDDV